jgi:hypothetical protein
VDPDSIEFAGDLELIVGRERKAFALGTITQRGIVE